jgi:single-stranded-DNA-specific exonuclease
MKALNKNTLYTLLNERFKEDDFTRLADLPDPFLLIDMEKSVKRIAEAMKKKEKITLIGDYDVDGVTSSVVINDFFDEIGYPLTTIIPNRFKDGYGISPKIMDRVDTNLIITVDNGISGHAAADICKERNIDLIITDHHTCGATLPDAYSIINPKRSDCSFPFKEICGAVVAWYLIAGIKKELTLDVDLKSYFDLLALATIADAMPLVSLNRVIVKYGLKVMSSTKRVSLEVFRERLNKEIINSEDVGFMIAPKLNAAGRMSSATEAFNFLRSNTKKEAVKWLDYLFKLNFDRREIESEITELAKLEVRNHDLITVVWGEGWHEGVIGIVASRLVDAFEKPAIVLSIENGIAKGSARSVGEVDIYTLIKAQESLLHGFGGHKQAAGMKLEEENLIHFREAINLAAKEVDPKDFEPQIDVIGDIGFDVLDIECFDIISHFEPYGQANPKPLFQANSVDVVFADWVGKESNHLKLTVAQEQNNIQKKGMAFFANVDIARGDKIDFAYSIVKNDFRNNTTIELQIKKFLS